MNEFEKVDETIIDDLEIIHDPQKPEPPKMPKKKANTGFWKGVIVGALSVFAICIIASGIFFGTLISMLGNVNPGGMEDKDTASANQSLLSISFMSEVALIESYLDEVFLYEADIEKLQDGMLVGLIEALNDPYSEYYNEAELESFNDTTAGEYVGIGAQVTQEIATGIIRITKPYEGTPSAEAGLLPGDMLISVDGVDVTGMELTEAVNLIKGEEGSTAIFHIYRESEEQYLDLEVTRRKVEIPTVTCKMLDHSIGYIEITSFDGVTTEQFINAYESLKAQGMTSVVMDLRNNGGGLVDTVEAMLDYLLPEGEIFYVKDKFDKKYMEYSSDAKAALDIPAVVLVNENTASASEIFAGNIQAFGLGKVVGTQTYGKGVMQQLFYTNNARTTGVKLTVSDYYINGDRNVHEVGVTPDVVVELDKEVATLLVIPVEQDNQLQEAIKVLGK